jgi:predicted nucleic acid-binding protein
MPFRHKFQVLREIRVERHLLTDARREAKCLAMAQPPPHPSGQTPLVGVAPSDLYDAKPFPEGLPRIFFDTSVISAIAARGTYNPLVVGEIVASRSLWRMRGELFNPVISSLIVNEIRKGDTQAAQKRTLLVEGVEALSITSEVEKIAKFLCFANAFHRNPDKAWQLGYDLGDIPNDAYHVAVAAFYQIPFLTSFDNDLVAVRNKALIESACKKIGYPPPLLLTPTDRRLLEVVRRQTNTGTGGNKP